MDLIALIKEYLTPELIPLVVVLYLIGMGIKNMQSIPDKYIPLILCGLSIIANALYVFSTQQISGSQQVAGAILTIFMQGVLFAGAAVLGDQIVKQYNKPE